MDTRRIAIQLYGHVRSFKRTYPYFKKNIVEALQKEGMIVDVFIHTWTELDYIISYVRHYSPDKRICGEPLTENDIDFIETSYKPRSFLMEQQKVLTVEEQEIEASNGIYGKSGYKNMAYTYYSVNKLRTDYEIANSISYDLVIATRPDIVFYKKLSLESIYRDFSEEERHNTLFYVDIPAVDNKYTYSINMRNMILGIDLFMIASPSVISTIADDWYLNKKYLIDKNSETSIAKIIHNKQIYLNLFQYPKHFYWNIKRTKEYNDNLLL